MLNLFRKEFNSQSQNYCNIKSHQITVYDVEVWVFTN